MTGGRHTGSADANLGGRLAAAAVILVVVIIAAYSNTFHSSFQFDDVPYITENMRLRDLGNFWPPSGTRYLSYLSFALNYHLSGLDTFGYHVTNTVIHIINSVLVYLLVVLAFRAPMLSENDREEGGVRGRVVFALALFCSVVFAAHPVQTESVTYITQRFASLTALFYLGSVVLYLVWRLGRTGALRVPGAPVYVLAVVSAVCAQLTKEIAFTLPTIIVLVEFLLFSGWSEEGEGTARTLGQRVVPLIPFLLTFAIVPLSMFMQPALPAEPGAHEGIEEMVRRLQTEELSGLSRHDYLLTQFRVLVTYLRLIVLPVNQNLEYDYPMYTTLADPAVFLSFLLLLAIFAGAVYLIYRSVRTKNPAGVFAGFGVLWFFITISIESSIVPILDVIFEHRLYMPLFGASAAAGGIVVWAFGTGRRQGAARALIVMTVISAVVFGAATYKRNTVWVDELTLYADIIEKSPEKPRARYDLGVIHYKAGRYNDAIDELRLATRLEPGYANAFFMLGEAYMAMGRPLDAIPVYEAAVREKPKKPMMHNNLGMAYLRVGRVADGISSLKRAIELRPGFSEAHNNLGMALADIGRTREAIAEYRLALESDPKNAAAHFNLAVAFEAVGNGAGAIEHYKSFMEFAGQGLAVYVPEAREAIRRLGGGG